MKTKTETLIMFVWVVGSLFFGAVFWYIVTRINPGMEWFWLRFRLDWRYLRSFEPFVLLVYHLPGVITFILGCIFIERKIMINTPPGGKVFAFAVILIIYLCLTVYIGYGYWRPSAESGIRLPPQIRWFALFLRRWRQ